MKNITIRSLRAKQKSDSKTAEKFFRKPKDESEDLSERKCSRSRFRKLINFIVLFIFVLVIGGAGGILIDRFAIPYLLVNYPRLNQYEFLKRINERTTIVEITKEVKISEDKAVVEAIKKILPSVIQIVEPIKNSDGKPNGEFIRKGTGVILTNDGVIITSLENINITDKEEAVSKKNDSGVDAVFGAKSNFPKVKLNNGEIYSVKLIAENDLTGFAIIKIKEVNLPVLAFAAFENIELGEKVIALDDSVAVDIVSKFVDSSETTENGAKKEIMKRIKIMNSLDKSFNGAPVVNLKGEIVGISQGGNLVVPMDEIMAFMNSAVNK